MIMSRQSWLLMNGHPVGPALTAVMEGVTVHHTFNPALSSTATSASEKAAMLSMHKAHLRRGWAGIGYHFVIFQSGRVYEGRGWGRVGAHAGTGPGNRTLGVAFAINGETTSPSADALDSLAAITGEGVRLGHLQRQPSIYMHRDWSSTSCPGRKVIDALRLPTPVPIGGVGVVLKQGDRGANVRALQELLVRLGFMTRADFDTGPGIFGPRTQKALDLFVKAHPSE